MVFLSSVAAAPLDVRVIDNIEVAAEMNSSYSTTYTMNITTFINISNNGNDDLSDIWIAIDMVNNVSELTLYYNGSSSNVLITGNASYATDATYGNLKTAGADVFVHIPILRVGEKVSLFYDVDDSKYGVPVLVDESYNVSKVPAKKTVSWKVYLNLSANSSAIPSGANLYVNLTKYLSNDTANFGSDNWTVLGPIANALELSSHGVSFTVWNGPYTSGNSDALNVTSSTGANLTTGPLNITFDVSGKSNVEARSSLEKFGFAVVYFKIDKNYSGAGIVDVYATGPARIQVTKEGPNSAMEWNESVNITNTAQGVTYVIRNVTLWAVPVVTGGFPDLTSVISGSYQTFSPGVTVAPGGNWTSAKYSFTYDNIPVIWANMSFELVQGATGYQILEETVNEYNDTYGSSYIVVEKIIVIGSYLIKATKYVKPAGGNLYDIYLVVENIGGERSPVVWVYDLVPQNFSVVNKMNVTQASMLRTNNSGNANFWWTVNQTNPGLGYKEGYAWELNPIEPNADGDGNYSDTAEISANQSVVIYYQVQGSGDYRLTEAFIVGVDPILSMNMQSSPRITIVTGSAARNYESLFALATGLLLTGAVVVRRR